MIITTEAEKAGLQEAGKRLREVLDTIRDLLVPGAVTADLDRKAYECIVKKGDTPAFLNYKPAGARRAFPATLCVSINNEIVHGIPTTETVIKEGDIVSIDCGLSHKGFFVDAAFSMIVGQGSREARALVEATRKALSYALIFARAGSTTGDIGNAVETVAFEHGFTVPPELGGHGVGAAQHEDPFIPNIGDPGQGEVFRDGEVVALEPIFLVGDDPRILLAEDEFTYCSADGSLAAHFEHTVLITNETPLIVTGPMW